MDLEKRKFSLDIYDLCSILNTVGFVVIDEDRFKQTRSCGRKMELICNVSGKKVYLESSSSECICWRHAGHDHAEKWEMSGTSGGIQTSKMENSITSWKELPKNAVNFIEKTVESLVEIVRGTNFSSNSLRERSSLASYVDIKLNKIKASCNLAMDGDGNISKSTLNMSSTVQKGNLPKDDANMYRSLDTLTTMDIDPVIPEPGILDGSKKSVGMVRQYTYTTNPPEDVVPEVVFPARTSSPVQSLSRFTFKKLLEAEKLSNELVNVILETKKMIEDETVENLGLSSYSMMDISKISEAKASEGISSAKKKQAYSSSPNLSGLKPESRIPNLNFRRVKSTSSQKVTSNIPPKGCNIQKSNSLRQTLPKKLTSIASTVSPSFGGLSGRKSLGSVGGTQVLGTFKHIGVRVSLGGAAKEPDLKKKNSLYSHIKPTIQRYTSTSKK